MHPGPWWVPGLGDGSLSVVSRWAGKLVTSSLACNVACAHTGRGLSWRRFRAAPRGVGLLVVRVMSTVVQSSALVGVYRRLVG